MQEDYDLSEAAECHFEINKVYRVSVRVAEAGGTQVCILTLRDRVRYYRDKLELTNTKQSGAANHTHGISQKCTGWEISACV